MKPGLVALAVALRLLLPASAWLTSHDETRFLTGDSKLYLSLAESLVLKSAYVDAEGPNLARPPGYPLLLAPGVWLGHPILWALIAHALLGGAMTAAVFEATKLVTRDSRAPRLAAAFAALDPVTAAWSGTVMAEALLAAWLALAAYLLLRALRRPSPARQALAGLAFAAAAFSKPIVSLVIPVVGAGLLLLPGSSSLRARATRAAVFLVAALLPLGGWALRNGLVADYWAFSSTSDRVLAFGAPASVVAQHQDRTFTEVREEWRASLQQPGFETAERMAALRARGLDQILAAPGTYALIHARGMLRTLLAPGTLPLLALFGAMPNADGRPLGAVVKDQGEGAALAWLPRAPVALALTLVLTIPQLVVLAAAGLGLARAHAEDRTSAALLALVVASLLVLSGGPWGQSRFRAPMVPELCILAGIGLQRRAA